MARRCFGAVLPQIPKASPPFNRSDFSPSRRHSRLTGHWRQKAAAVALTVPTFGSASQGSPPLEA